MLPGDKEILHYATLRSEWHNWSGLVRFILTRRSLGRSYLQFFFRSFRHILLLPVAHKHFQVLNIHDTVTIRSWANITERIILAPRANENNQVIGVYISITVEVNNRQDFLLWAKKACLGREKSDYFCHPCRIFLAMNAPESLTLNDVKEISLRTVWQSRHQYIVILRLIDYFLKKPISRRGKMTQYSQYQWFMEITMGRGS